LKFRFEIQHLTTSIKTKTFGAQIYYFEFEFSTFTILIMSRKKREYQSSELVNSFARIYGFEDKLKAFEIKDFLQDYLSDALFSEIEMVNLKEKVLVLRIKSPLLKNDFRMRKSFFLKKFQEVLKDESLINDLLIL